MMEVSSHVPIQSSADVRASQQQRTRVLSSVFVALGVTLLVSVVLVRTAAPAALTGAARVASKSLRPAAAQDPTVAFAAPGLAPPLPRSPTSSSQQQPRTSLTVRPAHGVVPLQMAAQPPPEGKNQNAFGRRALLLGGAGLYLASLQGSDPYALPEAPDPAELTGGKGLASSTNFHQKLNAAAGISKWRYTAFIDAVEAGEVQTVLFSPDALRAIVADTEGNLHALDALPKDPELFSILQKNKVDIEFLPRSV